MLLARISRFPGRKGSEGCKARGGEGSLGGGGDAGDGAASSVAGVVLSEDLEDFALFFWSSSNCSKEAISVSCASREKSSGFVWHIGQERSRQSQSWMQLAQKICAHGNAITSTTSSSKSLKQMGHSFSSLSFDMPLVVGFGPFVVG